MNTGLLKLATERRLGFRRFQAMAGGNKGIFTAFVSNNPEPYRLKGTWFCWNIHEHHDGRGGYEKSQKQIIRELVNKLVIRNS